MQIFYTYFLPLILLFARPDKWLTEPTEPSCHNRKKDLQHSNNCTKTTKIPPKPDLHLEVQTHCMSDTDTLSQLCISNACQMPWLALQPCNHFTWSALYFNAVYVPGMYLDVDTILATAKYCRNESKQYWNVSDWMKISGSEVVKAPILRAWN